MAKLKVKDKNGVVREMEERSFQLAGSKRGFTVIGKVETPAAAKSEVQKIMDQKIAERAAQQVTGELATKQTLPIGATSDLPKLEPKQEVVKEKAKPGPKPKTV